MDGANGWDTAHPKILGNNHFSTVATMEFSSPMTQPTLVL
jgi:hypothetical protein